MYTTAKKEGNLHAHSLVVKAMQKHSNELFSSKYSLYCKSLSE